MTKNKDDQKEDDQKGRLPKRRKWSDTKVTRLVLFKGLTF